MQSWSILIDILVLLAAALVLGTLAERFKQSAIVGYLLAGALVGPNALHLVSDPKSVDLMAELGVGLLLFTIGLEFSFRELRRMGRETLIAGALQIALTALLIVAWGPILGITLAAAVALGAMLALSSTASVARLLADRVALESPYGRYSMGILLFQDAAVLPLTLLVSALAIGGTVQETLWSLGKTILYGAVLVLAFLFFFNQVVPRLLNIRQWAANRELPILLAIVMAIGSAAAAHYAEISPAIGAFLAGLLLAESPFATQIRADIASLCTLLVTLFFGSVGMLADPSWVLGNLLVVLGVVVAVVLAKSAIVWGVLRALRVAPGMGLATGLCVAQVGEFSFVLAQIAANGGLIGDDLSKLIVAVTVLTLLVTPYLVKSAPLWAGRVEGLLARHRKREPAPPGGEAETGKTAAPEPEKPEGPRILIVGFGPAGQRVAESLIARHNQRMLVLDLNVRAASIAERYGLAMHVGNAAQAEVLEAAGIRQVSVVVLTLPDPAAARAAIHQIRLLNPSATVIVRARYHAYRWELHMAGAEIVVDEEEQVGLRLAAEARRAIQQQDE
mgnify:CR=1 FL=1